MGKKKPVSDYISELSFSGSLPPANHLLNIIGLTHKNEVEEWSHKATSGEYAFEAENIAYVFKP